VDQPTKKACKSLNIYFRKQPYRNGDNPMSADVKVFGCRPLTEAAARTGGRRRKTSKGGNRDGGTFAGAAG
jgi:hypothetical protein